jgi:hypothetical protein
VVNVDVMLYDDGGNVITRDGVRPRLGAPRQDGQLPVVVYQRGCARSEEARPGWPWSTGEGITPAPIVDRFRQNLESTTPSARLSPSW